MCSSTGTYGANFYCWCCSCRTGVALRSLFTHRTWTTSFTLWALRTGYTLWTLFAHWSLCTNRTTFPCIAFISFWTYRTHFTRVAFGTYRTTISLGSHRALIALNALRTYHSGISFRACISAYTLRTARPHRTYHSTWSDRAWTALVTLFSFWPLRTTISLWALRSWYYNRVVLTRCARTGIITICTIIIIHDSDTPLIKHSESCPSLSYSKDTLYVIMKMAFVISLEI